MKGFPARWVTKGSFGRPKTALVKLLKLEKVREEYTDAYTQRVYDCVWATFKKHSDDILAHRMKKNTIVDAVAPSAPRSARESVVEMGHESGMGSPIMRGGMYGMCENGSVGGADRLVDDDVESMHSVKIIRALAASTVRCPPPAAPAAGDDAAAAATTDAKWQSRYKILETAYRALLVHFGDKGLVASTTILLDALSGGDCV
jgi:hypothetical protein